MAWGWSGLIFLAFVFRKVRWTGSDEWFGVELFLVGWIVSQSVKVAFELCERSAVVVCARDLFFFFVSICFRQSIQSESKIRPIVYFPFLFDFKFLIIDKMVHDQKDQN